MSIKLDDILMIGNVKENQEYILEQIPELSNLVGFEHKHPHHHLDVWEHTLEVVNNIKIPDLETKMAGLLHDIGKPFSYQDEEVRHFHGHPQISAQMAKVILTRLNYSTQFITEVTYLVRTHDTIIDIEHLDNSYDMIFKRLALQYADAKAHAPTTVKKRIEFLDEISRKLTSIYLQKVKIQQKEER